MIILLKCDYIVLVLSWCAVKLATYIFVVKKYGKTVLYCNGLQSKVRIRPCNNYDIKHSNITRNTALLVEQ